MLNDWETPPTVEGMIVRAWIGDPDNPDPNRPFLLMGRAGTLARHGYQDAGRLIGKRCLIYSGGRFDTVAIEPEQGEEWPLVIWMEYSGIPFH